MATIKRRRPSIVTMTTAFADQSDAGDELVIPEDLGSLSDDELTDLSTRAREAFDAMYGDGSSLDDAAFEALAGLTEGIESLQAEASLRESAAAERAEAAAALAARVRPEPEAAADEPADEPAADEAEPVADGAEVEVDEPELVTASGAAAGERRISLSSLRSRATAAPARVEAEDTAPSIADYMVASGEGLGVAVGSALDFDGAGAALNRRLQSFNRSQYESANRMGRHVREQHALLSLNRPIPEDLQIRNNDPQHVRDIFDRAGDETRLPGASLVAAGGWCAPSQVLYDLVGEDESRDGLLSLPEIGVPRGGVSFTTGVDFADIYSQITGFSFTEQDDVDGFYAPGEVTGTAWPGANAVTEGAIYLVNGLYLHVTGAGTPAATAPASISIGETFESGTAEFQARATANVDGSKPCFRIECPEFEEYRLDVDGLCLTAGLLQSRGFPEVLARTVRGALVAHDHRINGRMISQMAAGSTAVTLPATQAGTAAPVLSAIELQVEHYRASRRLSRGTTLEAVFPYWVRGAIRSDLSRRLGVDLISVPNARIDEWFRERGINPQFVYNWQDVAATAAGSFTAWPSTVSFMLYSAGTWIRGAADVVTLDTIYDSTLLGNNDFTALFTEEGWFVAKRGQDSRLVTTSITADGAAHIGVDIAHNGTAS